MNINSDVLGCNHMDNLPDVAQLSDAMAVMSSVYNGNPFGTDAGSVTLRSAENRN